MKRVFVITTLFLSLALFAQLPRQFNIATVQFYKTDINLIEALLMNKKGTVFVDVRTKPEYDKFKNPNTVNVPILILKNEKRTFNLKFYKKVTTLIKNNKKSNLIFISNKGLRSRVASNLIAFYGFENVYNVELGYKKNNKVLK